MKAQDIDNNMSFVRTDSYSNDLIITALHSFSWQRSNNLTTFIVDDDVRLSTDNVKLMRCLVKS